MSGRGNGTVPDGSGSSRYTLKGNISSPLIETRINDTLLRIPREGYWYTAGDSREQSLDTEGYPLNHGLWCAQMEALLYALAGHAWPQVQAKTLDEGMEARDAVPACAREVVRAGVTVRAGCWRVKDNSLEVEWTVGDL